MIEKLDIKDFGSIFSIMERSFPKEEYRPKDGQKALFCDPAYRVYGVKENDCLVGFAAVWDLEDAIFLEHLAVEPACRNGGIGTALLGYLTKNAKQVCLEVEPPETQLACRRIGFYERNGFFMNHYPYMQPSLGQGRSPVKLYIMTSGGTIAPEEFAQIKSQLYTRVYGQRQQ